nr:hypothetical protein CFP56_44670 [Quercus suber]
MTTRSRCQSSSTPPCSYRSYSPPPPPPKASQSETRIHTLCLIETPIRFELTRDAVGDRLAILDLAVLAEDGGEGFDSGVPAEAVDEDLTVGGVCIGELMHNFNQVRVLFHSLLDQSHEMVLRERL